MIIRILRWTGVWCIIFSAFTPLILEAGTTGKITGQVTDSETGEPLIGVNIVVEGTRFGSATNAEGYYTILNIPPGTYRLSATYIGYQRTVVEEVRVRIDLTTNIDFELAPQAIAGDEVIVTADRPMVRKDRTSSEVQISSEELTQTPIQEVTDILQTKAGVTTDAGGGIHVRGGRGSEVVYWVDGVPVTDAYDGGAAVELEKGSIQELQMVTGTFNAEYGQAMSGIVNIVTKSGGEKLKGNVTLYGGDYYSRDDLYYNLDSFNPLENKNMQASLSGPFPLLGNSVKFYANMRQFYSDGYLYGANYFSPQGAHVVTTGPADSVNIGQYSESWYQTDTLSNGQIEVFDTGLRDSSATAMNWEDKTSLQTKLSFYPTDNLNFHLNFIGNQREFQSYDHFFRLNPNGRVQQFDNGYTGTFTLNHTLTQSTFYTLKASGFVSEYHNYLYEDTLSSQYVHPDSFNVPSYSFAGPGTSTNRFQRRTTTYLTKFDITSQIGRKHEVKAGVEYRRHELYLEGFSIIPATDSTGVPIEPFEPAIPKKSSPSYQYYKHNPVEFSTYVQDKIEYQNLIINIGLRFDYFDSRGQKPVDQMNPNVYLPFSDTLRTGEEKYYVNPDSVSVDRRKDIWYRDVDPEFQLSPRLGIAFPITDRGVIHFSYGHFLQIPSFQYLYNNPEWKVTTSGGLYGPYGNPELRSQKTVMYEIGLQQQVTDHMSFDITGYYRDIRDWVSVGPPKETQVAGVSWSEYVNRDYANVRGLSLVVDRRLYDHFGFNLNYTFQVAEGSNSDPNAEFFAYQNNEDPTQVILPLDWDQRHTLNASLMVGGKGWMLSLLGQYGSGYPYSPYINIATRTGRNVANNLPQNSRRKPATYNLDLRANKSVQVGGIDANFFLRVFNLLDIQNPNNVYADTGEPDYTTEARNVSEQAERNNTVEEYLKHPEWYVPPREIQWGVEVNF